MAGNLTRYCWVRDVPLGVSPLNDWVLVMPNDLPDHAVAALSGHPLVAELAGVLSDRRCSGQVPPSPLPVLRLIRAMVKGDAGSFTAAAAALTQSDVTVFDSDGLVIASSIKPERARPDAICEPAGHSRDILLRDESGLWGAIRLMSRPPAPASADGLLSDL